MRETIRDQNNSQASFLKENTPWSLCAGKLQVKYSSTRREAGLWLVEESAFGTALWPFFEYEHWHMKFTWETSQKGETFSETNHRLTFHNFSFLRVNKVKESETEDKRSIYRRIEHCWKQLSSLKREHTHVLCDFHKPKHCIMSPE